MNRRDFHIAIVGGLVRAAAGPSSAQEPEDEYTVKTSYVYNYCNYIRWPGYVAPKVVTVGLMGTALTDRATLETISLLEGQVVEGRKIVVKKFASPDKYAPCDLVYVTGSDARALEAIKLIAKQTAQQPVVIVGEAAKALESGATINFVRVGDKIKFEINRPAAERAKLTISAKLQRLAINKPE